METDKEKLLPKLRSGVPSATKSSLLWPIVQAHDEPRITPEEFEKVLRYELMGKSTHHDVHHRQCGSRFGKDGDNAARPP